MTAQRRIDHIDGLRALAVLGVIVHHIFVLRPGAGLGAHIANEGTHGVDLFFVLSGFCLAYPTLLKLRDGYATTFDVVRFGARRLVRILPPYYIATALLVLAFIVLPQVLHPGTTSPWAPRDVVASMLFLDRDTKLLNGAFWTLMVEFRWYLLFPALLVLWIRSPRAFFALGAAVVIAYTFTRARNLDLGTLPGFMLGIVAADLRLRPYGTSRWVDVARRCAFPLAAACIAIGVASEPYAWVPGGDGVEILYPYQPTILGWQAAMFFIVVAGGELVAFRSLLSQRALVAIGVASYGIYLVHQPVLQLANKHLAGSFGMCAELVLAVLAGFAFWAVAERPFTAGSLRAPLLDRSTVVVGAVCARLGISRAIVLHAHGDARAAGPDAPTAAKSRSPGAMV